LALARHWVMLTLLPDSIDRSNIMKHLLAAVVCLACAYPALVCAEEPKPGIIVVDPPPPAAPFKCEAGCSKCSYKATTHCLPAIKLNNVVYIVKVSDNANEATKKLVATLPDMKDFTSKKVKIVGNVMPEAEAAKASIAAKTEHKFWFEVGEMSLEE
jgi:hypothetical protein